jgi:hypothetical protein
VYDRKEYGSTTTINIMFYVFNCEVVFCNASNLFVVKYLVLHLLRSSCF